MTITSGRTGATGTRAAAAAAAAFGAATLLLALLPVASAQAAVPAADVVIELAEGRAPVVIEGAALVANLTEERGERVALVLNSTSWTVVEVRVRGWFEVERPRQVFPEFNGTLFTPVPRDPTDSDRTALLHNATGARRDFDIRLGVPALDYDGHPWSVRNLTLARDVVAPAFEVGPVTNVTHYGFLVTTTTSEWAFGDARVKPAAGGDEVENPTPRLALRQTFPVQGLDPATTYAYRFVFADWSGNEATSRTFLATTAPKPDGPKPYVTELLPPRGARLESPPDQVGARIASPESPLAEGGVRLFVDKSEVPQGFTFESGLLRYTPPAPLGPGAHSVSVEASNVAGGHVVVSWTFEVVRATPAASPVVLALTVALAVALARRR